jgi:UDP-N-acetylglucosamine 2-epimerase (non-hydrolysing)
MPEEINRPVTDQLAELLFTHSDDADVNLQREGISADKIHRVGNVMIDSLIRLLPEAEKHRMNSLPERHAMVTLHRPSNVDSSKALKGILDSILQVNRELGIVFPAHPRTRQRLQDFGLSADQLRILDPVPYIDFLALQKRATVVIADSGGIQKETTFLGVPCLTLRTNNEPPVTVSVGSNVLAGQDGNKLRERNRKRFCAGMPSRVPFLPYGMAEPASESQTFCRMKQASRRRENSSGVSFSFEQNRYSRHCGELARMEYF